MKHLTAWAYLTEKACGGLLTTQRPGQEKCLLEITPSLEGISTGIHNVL